MAATQGQAIRNVRTAPAEPFLLPAHEVAQYIGTLCNELSQLADHSGLGFLAYLLEVAREEAVLHGEPLKRGLVEIHGELPPR